MTRDDRFNFVSRIKTMEKRPLPLEWYKEVMGLGNPAKSHVLERMVKTLWDKHCDVRVFFPVKFQGPDRVKEVAKTFREWTENVKNFSFPLNGDNNEVPAEPSSPPADECTSYHVIVEDDGTIREECNTMHGLPVDKVYWLEFILAHNGTVDHKGEVFFDDACIEDVARTWSANKYTLMQVRLLARFIYCSLC